MTFRLRLDSFLLIVLLTILTARAVDDPLSLELLSNFLFCSRFLLALETLGFESIECFELECLGFDFAAKILFLGRGPVLSAKCGNYFHRILTF